MKYKRMPKKPKAGASTRVLENYLKRVQEVKKHNQKVTSDKKKRETLKEKVRKITADSVR